METKVVVPGFGEKDSFIVCRNSQGLEVRAVPLRLTRHQIIFEVYNPYSILQLSEVLNEFRIMMNDRLVYSGRAVVSNLVNTGLLLICEATLDVAWLDVDLFSPANQRIKLHAQFSEYIREWHKIYSVMPEFKVVVADMQTLLMDLRRWMEQAELGVRSLPSGDRLQVEREAIHELKEPILPALIPLFERFEETCKDIQEDLRPSHGTYVKRQLHPLVMSAPFFYRSFSKPLGYAGDYEMVNMMLRDPLEGSSMFAKMLNYFFLNTPPVVAHRNRITYLHERLKTETIRRAREGKIARFFNLGCGPAQEIQRFLMEDEESNQAAFTLLDFNDETLLHTGTLLNEIRTQYHRRTQIQTMKKSVHQILKDAAKPGPELMPASYEVVYCAGLFDYLSDRICKRLMNIFYDLLIPGGLLVATNVSSANPSKNWMEYVVEWHLVYRDSQLFASLAPDLAPPGTLEVKADPTGVNIFIEVRKPEDAG